MIHLFQITVIKQLFPTPHSHHKLTKLNKSRVITVQFIEQMKYATIIRNLITQIVVKLFNINYAVAVAVYLIEEDGQLSLLSLR